MFYTADSLRRMHQGGETVDFLFFYGHQLPSDGSTTESCLTVAFPALMRSIVNSIDVLCDNPGLPPGLFLYLCFPGGCE